jgi:hypothetical protein
MNADTLAAAVGELVLVILVLAGLVVGCAEVFELAADCAA